MQRKILYVLPPTKIFAGIERVVDDVCAEMAEQFGADLHIDVLHTCKYSNYEIPARPYRVRQEITTGRVSLLTTLRRVAASEPYDLIVVPQVEATTLTFLSCLGLSRKIALYLHGNPKLEMRSWKARILFALMEKVVLHRLAAVFGVSPTQLDAFRLMFPSRAPHYWLPNPVRRFASEEQCVRGDNGTVTFVNVGRYSYQKGQDILLRAFAKLKQVRPNARLRLIGFGLMKDELIELIQELDLKRHVTLDHQPDTPEEALRSGDIYVSASRWEGWSLAICEALRFGLPIVATNCDFGPSDILQDRRLGVLVPPNNHDELFQGLLSAYDTLAQERAYADYRRSYVAKFDVAAVARIHAETVLKVSGSRGLTASATGESSSEARV